MRQKLYLLLTLALLMTGCEQTPQPQSMTKRFQSVPELKATLLQKGEQRESCAICGMHLATFYKTNHVAQTLKGKTKQYCSLHCVVHDNELNKTDLTNLRVVDTQTLHFTPALKAYYVVGSRKPATMSRISKYAFAKKTDALAFQKAFGGEIMKFYDAYNVATKDFTKR